ncbi:hypothetical protein HMPREF0322_00383 [Desulfitobacterium hafniense DP7]|uniref:DUF4760 domain-containing protein n=1 Tax=Desulfitobacterium hafniense DP7 TaxID=537010 RepID=G9XHF8_DESHA|nr:hypothetical protein [Desulfitobacterium hafniense]EHL08960.1 hypothetical protein HMPREF0322_00383 [Desulfitobacterium hafniense DP7]
MSMPGSAWVILDVISNFLLVIVGIIGLLGLWIAKKDYKYRVERESIEKAVELSKFYADEILPGLEQLSLHIEGSKYLTEVSRLDHTQFYNFDREELCELLIAVDKNINTKNRIDEIYRLLGEALKKEWEDSEGGSGVKTIAIFKIGSLLNNLEYFAMNFTTNIADSNAVYASLHQTYLATIRSLYFIIAHHNEDPKDKFYTNIIKLYQIWSETDSKLKEEIERKKNEHNESIRTIGHQGKCLKT